MRDAHRRKGTRKEMSLLLLNGTPAQEQELLADIREGTTEELIKGVDASKRLLVDWIRVSEVAAKFGNGWILGWMLHKSTYAMSPRVCLIALEHGHTKLVQWLVSHCRTKVTAEAYNVMAVYGRSDMLRWLLKNEKYFDRTLLTEKTFAKGLAWSIANKDMRLMDTLRRAACPWDASAMEMVAHMKSAPHGVQLVHWAIEDGEDRLIDMTVYTIEHATVSAALPLLMWFIERDAPSPAVLAELAMDQRKDPRSDCTGATRTFLPEPYVKALYKSWATHALNIAHRDGQRGRALTDIALACISQGTLSDLEDVARWAIDNRSFYAAIPALIRAVALGSPFEGASIRECAKASVRRKIRIRRS